MHHPSINTASPQDKCFVKDVVHRNPKDGRRKHYSVAGTSCMRMSVRLWFIACISNLYDRVHASTKVPRDVTPSYLPSYQHTPFTACTLILRMHHSYMHQCTHIAVCTPIRAYLNTSHNTAPPHIERPATHTEVHTVVAASAVLLPD